MPQLHWEVLMTWCIVNLCEPQISWGAQHQVEALQKAAGLRDQAGRVDTGQVM